MSREWYASGLRFSCRGCGQCCRGPGGYVWVTESEARAMADRLGKSFEAFARHYLRRSGMRLALVDGPNGDCVFLKDGKRCTVYDIRPVQCSTFPWWPEVVRDQDSWNDEKRHCPGIGNGEVCPVEQIKAGIAKASSVD